MAKITRKYDFQDGNRAYAEMFDEEFDQIVNLLNGFLDADNFANSIELKMKNPVNLIDDLPLPEELDVMRFVKENNTLYLFDGTQWVESFRVIKRSDLEQPLLDELDGFHTSITAIENRLTVNESDIDSLETRTGVLETDLGIAKTDIDTLENNVSSINGEITNMKNDIDTVEVDVAQNKTDISVLQNTVSKLSNYDDTAIKQDISDLQNDKLDKTLADNTYQPKGDYVVEDANDPVARQSDLAGLGSGTGTGGTGDLTKADADNFYQPKEDPTDPYAKMSDLSSAGGGSSYDDTELQNRITELEEEKTIKHFKTFSEMDLTKKGEVAFITSEKAYYERNYDVGEEQTKQSIIPALTTYNDKGYLVEMTQGTEYTTYYAWKLFDGISAVSNAFRSDSTITSIKITFDELKNNISDISISPYSVSYKDYLPKSFKVYVYQNGVKNEALNIENKTTETWGDKETFPLNQLFNNVEAMEFEILEANRSDNRKIIGEFEILQSGTSEYTKIAQIGEGGNVEPVVLPNNLIKSFVNLTDENVSKGEVFLVENEKAVYKKMLDDSEAGEPSKIVPSLTSNNDLGYSVSLVGYASSNYELFKMFDRDTTGASFFSMATSPMTIKVLFDEVKDGITHFEMIQGDHAHRSPKGFEIYIIQNGVSTLALSVSNKTDWGMNIPYRPILNEKYDNVEGYEFVLTEESGTTNNSGIKTTYIYEMNLLQSINQYEVIGKFGEISEGGNSGETYDDTALVNRINELEDYHKTEIESVDNTKDLLPTLPTFDNTIDGERYVVQASSYYSTFSPQKAFQDTTGNDVGSGWLAYQNQLPATLDVSFSNPKDIGGFSILPFNVSNESKRNIKSLTFEYSLDYNQDTKSGTFIPAKTFDNISWGTVGPKKEFLLDSPIKGAKAARVKVLSAIGADSYVGLAELELHPLKKEVIIADYLTKDKADTFYAKISDLYDDSEVRGLIVDVEEDVKAFKSKIASYEVNDTSSVIPSLTSADQVVAGERFLVEASGSHSSYQSYRAFDGLEGNNLGYSWLAPDSYPVSLAISFENPRNIGGFSIKPTSEGGTTKRAVKDFSLQYSLDYDQNTKTGNWITAEYYDGVSFSSDTEEKKFILGNPIIGAKALRLMITANNGDTSYVGLSEWKIFEAIEKIEVLSVDAANNLYHKKDTDIVIKKNIPNLILETPDGKKAEVLFNANETADYGFFIVHNGLKMLRIQNNKVSINDGSGTYNEVATKKDVSSGGKKEYVSFVLSGLFSKSVGTSIITETVPFNTIEHNKTNKLTWTSNGGAITIPKDGFYNIFAYLDYNGPNFPVELWASFWVKRNGTLAETIRFDVHNSQENTAKNELIGARTFKFQAGDTIEIALRYDNLSSTTGSLGIITTNTVLQITEI